MAEKKSQEKKPRSGKRIVLDILIIVCAGVAAFAAWRVISQLMSDKKGEDIYSEIQQQAVSASDDEPGSTQPAVETEVEVDGETKTVLLRHIDFDALKAQNPDIVGWLECVDTVIDYPVVQAEDNDYYLRRLFDGSSHRYGTLFLDFQNAADFTDDNTIIYGHHIKNGAMFGTLKNYRDNQEYYQEHPVFMLYTPDHSYMVEIFSDCYVNGNNGIPINFATREEYQAYIDELIRDSTIRTEVKMTAEDRMLTLYTCSYDYEGQRQLLCGKLTEIT